MATLRLRRQRWQTVGWLSAAVLAYTLLAWWRPGWAVTIAFVVLMLAALDLAGLGVYAVWLWYARRRNRRAYETGVGDALRVVGPRTPVEDQPGWDAYRDGAP